MIGIASVVTRMPDKDPARARGIPEDHPAQFYLPPGIDSSDPRLDDPVWKTFQGHPSRPGPQLKVGDAEQQPSNPVPTESLLFRVSPPPAGGSNNPWDGAWSDDLTLPAWVTKAGQAKGSSMSKE